MNRTDVTRQIAECCTGYNYDTLPPDVIETAKVSILDNLGCALRGADELITRIVGLELLGRDVTVNDLMPGADIPVRPNERALLHGVSAHAIDFDDTFIPAKSAHAGSAVVGALMAILPSARPTGKEVIESVVAGYEASARVGELLHPDHYLKGFHPTCTVGVFAAAATSARLLKLTTEQTCAVFGLASTQSSGLKCTFGTMAKPFNAGNAAAGGVLAARLVANGFTAPLSALEADKGYLSMYLGLPENERVVVGPESFYIGEVMFKNYAACHATHPLIEVVRGLQGRTPFEAEEVKQVTVAVPDLFLKTASIITPTTGLECKFSFNQVAASAICGLNMAADDTYDDVVLSNRRINTLREKVRVEVDDTRVTEMGVDIKLTNRKPLSIVYDFTKLKNKPLSEQLPELKNKFMANTARLLGDDGAVKLMNAVFSIDASEDAFTVIS